MVCLRSPSLRILLFVTCIAFAQCVLEPGDTFGIQDKSDDAVQMHKRPSFFVGSRYGRSGSPVFFAPSKARRLSVVPRNDRFFLGSRYGKRAGEAYLPYEQASNNNNDGLTIPHTADSDDVTAVALDTIFGGKHATSSNTSFRPTENGVNNMTPFMMSCTFTGLRNLYRCNNADEVVNRAASSLRAEDSETK